MGKKDPRVDAYIEKAQPFAQPILRHLRKVARQASRDCGRVDCRRKGAQLEVREEIGVFIPQ
jgi:hypothetical protein